MIAPRRTLLVLLAAAIGLSGCGSSAPAHVNGDVTVTATSSSTSSVAGSTSSGLGEPLHDVGTLTIAGEDTTISARYRIGPIIYSTTGTPPSEVLEACNMNYTSEIPKLAFIRGQVSVSYTHGSLPIFVGVMSEELVSGQRWAGLVAFDVNGSWVCGQSETPPGETLHPGESEHYELWVLADVLSNEHPKVTPAMSANWQFGPAGINAGIYNSTVTASGPGARTCESEGASEATLFLYPTKGSCEPSG